MHYIENTLLYYYTKSEISQIRPIDNMQQIADAVQNGILFILNAVGKSEKSFPTEKEK